MTSLKIYLQQSQRCQEFSHKDISAQETSYAGRCTRPLVQRYKAKHALRQNSTKLIKLFDFLFFMCFWIFDTKKKNDKTSNVKTFNAKANKQPVVNSNNQQAHNQTQSHNIESIYAWTCCNAYA